MPEIKGTIIFAFSQEGDSFHVYYDEYLAQGPGFNRVAGAIFKLMQEYPELIEEILQAAVRASEDLSKPFNNILNESSSEN